MSNVKYPTGDELEEYLSAFGLTVHSTALADRLAQAAATRWERHTGWHPFLSDGEVAARTFAPQPGRPDQYLPSGARSRLFLHTGLLSAWSVTVAGKVLEEGSGYGFYPRDGITLEPPFTDLWLRVPGSQRVTIEGVWGFCKSLPLDVKEILLQSAASAAFPSLEFSQTNGVSSVQTLTSKVTFSSGSGGSAFSRTATEWQDAYRSAVLEYRLIGLGR